MQRIGRLRFAFLARVGALAHAAQRDNINKSFASIAPRHGESLGFFKVQCLRWRFSWFVW